VRLGELTDALLARAGVDPPAVPTARRVLIVHTIGSAAFATGTGPSAARSNRWRSTGIPKQESRGQLPGQPELAVRRHRARGSVAPCPSSPALHDVVDAIEPLVNSVSPAVICHDLRAAGIQRRE